MNMHRQIVILGDGRRIPVYVINFGYSEERGGYLTLFVHARSAASAGSLFECAPKRRYVCPDPAARLAQDMQVLEIFVKREFGSDLSDLAA